MAGDEQNRSEAATPHKIQEAKKRGSVAKSMEINSFAVLSMLLVVLHLWGWNIAQRHLHVSQRLLSQAYQMNFETAHLISWLNSVILDTLSVLAPLFILLAAAAVLGNMAQTGPIFTLFPLKPDFDRINPVAGFKRVYSLRMLLEGCKSLIKLILYGAVLYLAIKRMLPDLMQMMQINPGAHGRIVLSQCVSLLSRLLCAVALVALIDILYVRREYHKKLMMSRREIKEEVKRRDGDPRVRARIRELQRETLKRSKTAGKVQEADVLITNPIHYAVAVKYERDRMQAPQVLAKGAGKLAGVMKDVARRHRVPVVENKKLARALYRQVDLGGAVPEDLYSDVARLLVWIYAMREQSRPKEQRA